MGAGLLAKAVCQSTSLLNDTPHSRASPLPHGVCVMPMTMQHPLPNHPANSFESSIRALIAPCINGSTGITRAQEEE
ncbi:hypothetical protein CRX42_19015 [Pseudomonas jessenii]|uniref:Uncharacterized protein n=1 Tax=Pseudomonas jessenii TaxID=77298 RepID=A0A2W0EKE2_PSEJE|nr:hypothetical protein CRX42_19015 [Pseudomonas jessenii]